MVVELSDVSTFLADARHHLDGLDRVSSYRRLPRQHHGIASSRIALATSKASARVGRGDSIIDWNICVAVMTGLPSALQRWIMYASGPLAQRSGAISTPRSPARPSHRPQSSQPSSRIRQRLRLLYLRYKARDHVGIVAHPRFRCVSACARDNRLLPLHQARAQRRGPGSPDRGLALPLLDLSRSRHRCARPHQVD